MKTENFKIKSRRDFNNAMCLMGVIPFLAFVYLLISSIGSFEIFIGEAGYIMFTAVLVFLTGIVTSRKVLWPSVKRLIDNNYDMIEIQQKMIDENRLAAIKETALTLSHEINNPLMVVRGNIELLEEDFSEENLSDIVKEKIVKIKTHCDKIANITDKISDIIKPISENNLANTNIFKKSKTS